MTPIVFVTGGNRGIGLEIVRGYAKAGCKVLMGCRDEDAGEEVKQDIPEDVPGLDPRCVWTT